MCSLQMTKVMFLVVDRLIKRAMILCENWCKKLCFFLELKFLLLFFKDVPCLASLYELVHLCAEDKK